MTTQLAQLLYQIKKQATVNQLISQLELNENKKPTFIIPHLVHKKKISLLQHHSVITLNKIKQLNNTSLNFVEK